MKNNEASKGGKPPKRKFTKAELATTKGKKIKELWQTDLGRTALLHKALNIVGIVASLGVMLGSLLMVILSLYLVNITKNDDTHLNLNNIKLSFTTILYAKDEKSGDWVEYQRLSGNEYRIWVDIKDIPEVLQQAFIAIEDNTFKTHSGVNWKRSLASFVNEYSPIKLFSSRQGGSTITQQLVKNLTSDEKQDMMRKVREIYRALVLEKQFSKDMILEAYLNTLRLTGNTAGVQAGANKYFAKDVKDVTIAEAAALAAITKNPSVYNPFTNPEELIARRDYVLQLMQEQGYITKEQHDAAVAEPLKLATGEEPIQNITVTSYFTDKVIADVIEDLREAYGYTEAEATHLLYNGGLRIYTTVVPELQSAMEKVMTEAKEFPIAKSKLHEDTYPQAAMISLKYDGGIAACVGGLGEKTADRGLNRATDSLRPIGSTMKPIGVYALAIDYGFVNYSTTIMDSAWKQIKNDKGVYADWPRNYTPGYSDVGVTVADAIARSLNTIAVKTLDMVGPRASFDFLHDTLHVESLVKSENGKSDIDYGPMALGSLTHGMKPMELAGAYMMFGNGGKYSTVHSYTTVEDPQGNVLLEKSVTTVQAISEETAMIMNRMLSNVLSYGTAAGLAPGRMPAVGKTGTTSDNKDHWFVGLTPYYVTATWWGFDMQEELKVNYSSHPPTTSWRNVMNLAQKDLPVKNFPVSSKVQVLSYCKASGDLAGPACPDVAEGYYKEGNIPGVCIYHY